MPEKRREHDLGFLASLRKTEQKGILIQELGTGDIIVIETKNSRYILKVLDPEKQKVEITKTEGDLHQHFQKPTVTCVQGSCLTRMGTAIRIGWIAAGHRLELTSGNVVLTAAQRIFVNGKQIFPPTDEKGN